MDHGEMIIKNLTDFNAKLADAGDKIVVIDFFAEWCPPCKFIGPKFIELAKQFEGKGFFYKVDVDEAEDVSA